MILRVGLFREDGFLAQRVPVVRPGDHRASLSRRLPHRWAVAPRYARVRRRCGRDHRLYHDVQQRCRQHRRPGPGLRSHDRQHLHRQRWVGHCHGRRVSRCGRRSARRVHDHDGQPDPARDRSHAVQQLDQRRGRHPPLQCQGHEQLRRHRGDCRLSESVRRIRWRHHHRLLPLPGDNVGRGDHPVQWLG
jgi:hypothetical protein